MDSITVTPPSVLYGNEVKQCIHFFKNAGVGDDDKSCFNFWLHRPPQFLMALLSLIRIC